jgi:hypothetical protein
MQNEANVTIVIRNCVVQFRRLCPMIWERLRPTAGDMVRLCDTCRREVFFCAPDTEALQHSRAGYCIVGPMLDGSE